MDELFMSVWRLHILSCCRSYAFSTSS